MEVVQASPADIPTGYFSARIIVNGDSIDQSYFGNFELSNKLFGGMIVSFDLCGKFNSGTTTLSTDNTGSSDILNFRWFDGTQNLISDPPSMRYRL